MVYRPLDEKTYRKFLRIAGWDLIKGKIDYKLLDENGIYVCTVQIGHSKRGKQEVTAYSVQKTEREFKHKGLIWPPPKK